MRLLFVLLVVVVAPAIARADAGKIVVPAIDSARVEGAKAQRLEQAIKDVLAKTLVDRVVIVNEKASCARDAACVKGLLEQHGADELASFTLESQGGAVFVSVEVKDAQGKVAVRAKQKLPATGVEDDLARFVVASLTPSRYTGRLVVDGTPQGGQVIVDDLPIIAADARDRTTLSVGTHRILFVPPDGGAPISKDVVVPYGEQVVVTFPAPPKSSSKDAVGGPAVVLAQPSGMPMWPAYVTGGLAAGGLVTAITVITIELYAKEDTDIATGIQLAALRGPSAPPVEDDPNRQRWQGYGHPSSGDYHAAGAAAAATRLAILDLATTLSWATVGGAAAIAVFGGLGTGALVAASLSAPAATESE